MVKFGLKEESNVSTGIPSEKLQDLQELHPANKDNGFRDVDLAVDSQENQTSTGNLHEENPHKYRGNVNPVDSVDVSNGVSVHSPNSFIKTVAIGGKPVKLDYDQEAGTIVVERDGKKHIVYDFEPEFQEYLRQTGL